MDKLKLAEQALITDDIPEFEAGDTVNIHYRVREGEKERIQQFEGTVISRKGSGSNKTFMVRKISAGNIGVERIFPLFSPFIAKIEVMKRGDIRRSKLFYLRDRQGKSARIKEKDRDATERIEERERARKEAREEEAAEEEAAREKEQDEAAGEASEQEPAAEETAESAETETQAAGEMDQTEEQVSETDSESAAEKETEEAPQAEEDGETDEEKK